MSGQYLQMKFGKQNQMQQTMQKEITLKKTLNGKLYPMIKNILIIYENNIEIPNSFLSSGYQPVPDDIYQKYTIKTWVKTVFKDVL